MICIFAPGGNRAESLFSRMVVFLIANTYLYRKYSIKIKKSEGLDPKVGAPERCPDLVDQFYVNAYSSNPNTKIIKYFEKDTGEGGGGDMRMFGVVEGCLNRLRIRVMGRKSIIILPGLWGREKRSIFGYP